MAIKIKVGGSYSDAVGIYSKKNGAYTAVQGVFAKSSGTYASVSGVSIPQSASIVAQWSADSLSLADGAAVASWTDSKSGLVASQGTVANRPVFKTNIYNGKPAIRFDGTNDCLLVANPATAISSVINSQTFTVLIAFQQRGKTSGGGYGTLFSYKNVGAGTHYYISDSTDGTDAANRIHRYPMIGANGSIPFNYATYGNTLCTFGNTSGVGGVLGLSALERAYVNGGCVCSDTAKAPAAHLTTPDFMFGSSVASSFPFNGDLFEVVVWNRELTPPEVAQFHAWVCSKYGRTVPWSALSYMTVFDGDSITSGVLETNSSRGDIYPYKTAQSLGLSYGQWSNLGIGYLTMSQMTTKFATDVQPLAAITGKTLKIAAFEWYNQKAAAPTPENNSRTYLSTVRATGAKVCFGTSTDTNQTTDTNRANYNAAFDSNHADCDAYVAIHNNANIGVETAFATTPSYFSSDGVHLSATGYTTLASLMTTGMQSIT